VHEALSEALSPRYQKGRLEAWMGKMSALEWVGEHPILVFVMVILFLGSLERIVSMMTCACA